MMNTVLSGTELENLFWLRDDGAADPTIAELVRCMREARDESEAMLLYPGEYHLPYLERKRGAFDGDEGTLYYGDYDENGEWINYSLDDAIKISCARCAAVSFRNVDYGLEKCREVYERLVGDERKHASAFEHQGSPMNELYPKVYFNGGGDVEVKSCVPDGVSHISLEDGRAWSGNLRGWVQYRKTIPGENYTGQ
jgi:hypothetical protein